MMRIGHATCLVPLVLLLAVVPAKAQVPAPRVTLLVQPARGDFDQDGRADLAAGVLTNPSIVRITLSSAGQRDLAQPSAVLAVAVFDYDADGDLDLLVATSAGTLLWFNDGHGAFSVVPLVLSSGAPVRSQSVWTTSPTVINDMPEQQGSAIACDRDDPWDLIVRDPAGRAPEASMADVPFSAASPRAPPRA